MTSPFARRSGGREPTLLERMKNSPLENRKIRLRGFRIAGSGAQPKIVIPKEAAPRS
jgi:hypothetical protein